VRGCRLIVSKASDLTTIRVTGRLGNGVVSLLDEACSRARRPLVLDLSELTGASDGGVLLLRRLAAEGVHLVAASRYVRLLLEHASPAPGAPPAGRRGLRPARAQPAAPRGRASGRAGSWFSPWDAAPHLGRACRIRLEPPTWPCP
jgi:hypothetical protein